MTIISLVKKMTIKLQSILEWFTSTHNFFLFSPEIFYCAVRLAKRTLDSLKPNMCWQVLTMLMSEVFSNFMNSLFTTKASELISRFLSGHASIPNINAGIHLVSIDDHRRRITLTWLATKNYRQYNVRRIIFMLRAILCHTKRFLCCARDKWNSVQWWASSLKIRKLYAAKDIGPMSMYAMGRPMGGETQYPYPVHNWRPFGNAIIGYKCPQVIANRKKPGRAFAQWSRVTRG